MQTKTPLNMPTAEKTLNMLNQGAQKNMSWIWASLHREAIQQTHRQVGVKGSCSEVSVDAPCTLEEPEGPCHAMEGRPGREERRDEKGGAHLPRMV